MVSQAFSVRIIFYIRSYLMKLDDQHDSRHEFYINELLLGHQVPLVVMELTNSLYVHGIVVNMKPEISWQFRR